MFQRWAPLFLLISPLLAQGTCDMAFPPITPPGPTIFTQEQEGFLGDFFEEQARRSTAVYRQASLTGRMDQIAAKLLQFMPANTHKFQFTLIELPVANAYAIPGGRIFVSRLLVASLENEDELAGILAHEMGHVLARQGSADMTKYLREGFKVTLLGDRADVYNKMNALIDAPGRTSKIRASNVEDDQVEADRISSAATWRAGYDPGGLPRWIDRMSNNKGATGNFLSDLFGGTRPESKRYREMLKIIENVPVACRQTRAAAEESFVAWQKRVTDLAPEDLLTTNSTRTPTVKLLPVLRPDLSNIRFSPDGRYLLAQDQAGIFLLDAQPLNLRMRIPALGAAAAVFHKDSQHILFQSGTGRIEIWNVQTQFRERRWDLPMGVRCQDVILSPDAKAFACMARYGAYFALYDLDSGVKLAEHGYFLESLSLLETLLSGRPKSYGLFSPDGSIFAVGSRVQTDDPWAFNLTQRKEVSVGQPLKKALNGSFAFLDNGRVATVAINNADSGVFSFPEGKQISKFTIPPTSIYAATKGDTLLLRPMGSYAVGLMSMEDKEIYQAGTKAAADRYGDLGASERNSGELALYRGKSSQPVASLQLLEGGLTGLRSATHSPDFSWLAMSAGTRGQIWNLSRGGSSLTTAFDGGSITPEGTWTATFEQRDQKPGSTTFTMEKFRIAIDLANGKEVSNVKIAREEGVRSYFSGRYEVRVARAEAKSKARIDVREAATGKLQWTRHFEDTPQIYLGNALVVRLDPDGKDGRDMVKKLKDRGVVRTEDSELLDVVNLETGVSSGQLMIEVGGTIRTANMVGGALFLEDTNNRTLAYALDSGERTGQQFGRILAADPSQGRVAMSNQLGSVSVLDKGLRGIANFEYPRNVIYAGFDGAGKRLLVVTGAQEVFIENLPE